MLTQLNGWQRIGIVLSVIWILVGGFWGNTIGFHEGDPALYAHRVCLETHPDDWPGCGRIFTRDFIEATKDQAAFVAFVPIPIAWLIVYGFVGLFRWIGRGFKPLT